MRPRQDGRRFPDDMFKWIFLNENVYILIQISLKFVLNGPINNIPALVQIMAWRRPGDNPLFEPMMVSLLTHLCVTRPQWVNVLQGWIYLIYCLCHYINDMFICNVCGFQWYLATLFSILYMWHCFAYIYLRYCVVFAVFRYIYRIIYGLTWMKTLGRKWSDSAPSFHIRRPWHKVDINTLRTRQFWSSII